MADPNTLEANVDVAVGVTKGKVVIRFQRPVENWVLDPQNGFDIAESMARAAHRAKFGTEPPTDASYLGQQVRARVTEQLRQRMVARATVMMTSLYDKSKTPNEIAKLVVDALLAQAT